MTAGTGARAGTPSIGTLRPADLPDEVVDLVVVGGGITGAGVARHAALAGLNAVVLEAGDFAAGTSSRSTKLVHGGLRYLAMGDFALVRESALERKSLLAMAPHLTEPRWMLVPAADRLTFFKLRVGISLYEWLGAVSRAERHRNWNGKDLEQGEPLLDRSRLRFACVYREYLTDDARLVLATLRAAALCGAAACNYARVDSVVQEGGICRVSVVDQLSGAVRELRARVVVNAAGPWVESLLQPGNDHQRLHLSKGVHLVLDRARLPVQHMVMMTARDGRPVFAIARGNVTYVGTTDTSFDGAPTHWPEVNADDVDYLLETANSHFQVPTLTHDDVQATWAGLRPLIHQPGKAPKEMSRRDEIWRSGALVTVAGGKLTGFRKMAEEAMAAVADVLGRPLHVPEPLSPLPGGAVADLPALTDRVAARYQLESRTAVRLVRLYGSEVFDVLGERPDPITTSAFAQEVLWAVNVEGARSVEDVVYRRLRAAWFLPGEVDALAAGAGRLLAAQLGWDDARRDDEVRRTRMRLASELEFRAGEATETSLV